MKIKKNEEAKISVIVPVYNSKEYVDKCITSILNQTYKNLEIILVDDGSSDNSLEVCKKFENIDNRIKCIHIKNNGVSTARNIGLDISTGEFIGFVDSDDIIEKDMYEKLYDNIIKNKTDLVICNYKPNNDFKNISKIISNKLALEYLFYKDKYRGYVWNKLYKKSLISNQRFDKDIHVCEDLLFNCKYILKCKKISIINEKLYNYIKNSNSVTNIYKDNSKKETALKSYEKMINLLDDKYENIVNLLKTLYIKEYSYIRFLKNKKCLKSSNETAKKIYKELINSNNISVIKKIEVFLYYNFSTIIQTLRKMLYYINKNKR